MTQLDSTFLQALLKSHPFTQKRKQTINKEKTNYSFYHPPPTEEPEQEQEQEQEQQEQQQQQQQQPHNKTPTFFPAFIHLPPKEKTTLNPTPDPAFPPRFQSFHPRHTRQVR